MNKQQQWNKWKQNFGSQLTVTEQKFRQMIFMKNLQQIQNHNANPKSTYQMGINKFAALKHQQFVHLYLINQPRNKVDRKNFQTVIIPRNSSGSITANGFVDIDWTLRGKVSSVKDQGQCGSCWAFSAIAVTQSLKLIKSGGAQIDLSQQELVDCTLKKPYRCYGCNGGWGTVALRYIKDKGIASQVNYPYRERNQRCKTVARSYTISTTKTTIAGCPGLQQIIYQRPVAVAVDATNWSPYKSGIFNNCNRNLNHQVLLVGIVGGNWKIKNSWDESWGQNGFMRLTMGNTCGICVQGGFWPQ